MSYTIHSDHYADHSVTVNGPRVIAYGVAEAIHKQERIDVYIKDAEGEVIQSFYTKK